MSEQKRKIKFKFWNNCKVIFSTWWLNNIISHLW